MAKTAWCQYDASPDFECAVEGLRVYVPVEQGYIRYNIVRSVSEKNNFDIWRIGKAFACDGNLENDYEITPENAEWDMAIKLQGRCDFIGGFAHGDERYKDFSVWLDGNQTEVSSLIMPETFETLVIRERSVGFDPDNPGTEALLHEKEYIIDGKGITLHQRVEWLRPFAVGASYMAMMPPLKTVTDSYQVDDGDPVRIGQKDCFSIRVPGAVKAVVSGAQSRFRFLMEVPRYPHLPGGNAFILTDNSGGRYNKMYFVVCNGTDVSAGDIWETTTRYQITKG